MELLAPAGSFQALQQAIYNGADAVYFGYTALNARASAQNINDMAKAVSFCHLFNVKAYLTLNITLKINEIKLAENIIKEADNAKIDAFIITDLALLPIIKHLAPNTEVHASTQMGIHNRYGALFLEKLGFDRIILSREVTLDDIKDIKKHTNIPLEVFVHGAICIGFSGGCLFSSMLSGKSGNRGRCLQLCRKNYEAYIDEQKKSSGYLLSAKDLCMINRLSELKDAGVSSLKIEGRLKRTEYVAGCVREYRKALDYGLNNDYSVLKRLFNRGEYTEGYSFDDKIVYPNAPNHIGVKIGRVLEKSKDNIIIALNKPIQKNDGFKILRNNLEIGGFVGKGATETDFIIEKSKNFRGVYYYYKLKNTMNALVGDEIAITTDSKQNEELLNNVRRLKIDFEITLIPAHKAIIKAKYNDKEITLNETIVKDAINQPLSNDDIIEQFSKLGDTEFQLNNIKIESKNAFLTKAELNQLKRQAINLLKDKIISCYTRKSSRPYNDIIGEYKKIIKIDKSKINNCFSLKNNENRIYVEIKDISQYTKLMKDKNINIVYSPDNFEIESSYAFYKFVKSEGNIVFIKLPIYADSKSLNTIKNACIPFDGLICNNYYAIMLNLEYRKLMVLGYNMNITNNRNPLIEFCDDYIISPELNLSESADFDGVLYAYGHLPLMYLSQCPRKTIGINCKECNGNLVFKDKKGYYIIDKQSIDNNKCMNILKNGVITDIGSKIAINYGLYLDLSTASNTLDTDKILFDYINKKRNPEGMHTLNHLKRGIE